MKDPRQALAAAREAAARAGAEQDPEPAAASTAVGARRLLDWAIIEPDEAGVYSTRAYGKPITLFKRLLVRLLRQYLLELAAQQSRFNAQVAAHVVRLEERVGELERRQPPS